MKNNLLIFGTKNFNNSLHEVKEYFNYSLTFFDSNTFSQQSISKINFILVDSDVCVNLQVLDTINQIKNKSIYSYSLKHAKIIKSKYKSSIIGITTDKKDILKKKISDVFLINRPAKI